MQGAREAKRSCEEAAWISIYMDRNQHASERDAEIEWDRWGARKVRSWKIWGQILKGTDDGE